MIPLPIATPAAVLLSLAMLSAAASAEELERVVVTGSLLRQDAARTLATVSVVTAEDIRSAGPQVNLSEALVRVPGVVANQRSNYAQDLQISSRGFGARATFGVRGIRIFSDGIPATMPDGQGQAAHIDLAGAERIEVVRGPFSALYGNAAGGVISVFSAAVDGGKVAAGIDRGSFGLRQERIEAEAPLGAGVDGAISAAHLEVGGFRPQSAARRNLANGRLRWHSAEDHVDVLLSSQVQDAQDPLGLTRAQFDAFAEQTTPEALQFNTRKTIEQKQLGARWRHGFAGSGALKEASITAYRGTRSVIQRQAIPASAQANPRHGGGMVDFDRAYDGVDTRAFAKWVGWSAVAGASMERARDSRRGYENFAGSGSSQILGVTGKLRRDEVNEAETREVYAQVERAVSPNASLTIGLRQGSVRMEVNDRFLSNGNDSGELSFRYVNPVAGFRWSLDGDWQMHASVARGFESPTLSEVAYRPDAGAGINDTLKAQTSRQGELGARWKSERSTFDITLFRADTKDEIGVATSSGGRATYRNLGRTERYGVEAAATIQVSPAWRMDLAASVLRASYRDAFLTCPGTPCASASVPVPVGNRIAGTQRTNGFMALVWRPVGDGSELAVEWRAAGRAPVNDLNSDFAPGYAITNARWRWLRAITVQDELECLVRLENLFDRKYSGTVIVNDANGRFFEPGSPRSASLSLRLSHRW